MSSDLYTPTCRYSDRLYNQSDQVVCITDSVSPTLYHRLYVTGSVSRTLCHGLCVTGLVSLVTDSPHAVLYSRRLNPGLVRETFPERVHMITDITYIEQVLAVNAAPPRRTKPFLLYSYGTPDRSIKWR